MTGGVLVERGAALTSRDLGVDLARGFAILAMVIAHVKMWWQIDSRPLSFALAQINNLASPLFCLVMGVAAGLVLTRTARPVRPAAFVARNAVRGIALIAIGLLIEDLPSNIAIVLQVLGVVLVVGSPLLLLGERVILLLALVIFVVGPMINEIAMGAYVPPLDRGPWDRVLEWVVASRHYRLTNLLPFFLVGGFIALRGLRRRDLRVVTLLGVAGLPAIVASAVLMESRTSGSFVDNISDLALSFTAFGVIMLLAGAARSHGAVRALAPLAAVGAVSLSAYVFHVLLIAAFNRYVGWPTLLGHPLLPSVVVLVLTVGVGWLWWRMLGRGPVERLLALVTDQIR